MKTLKLIIICLSVTTVAFTQSSSDLLLINQDREQLNQKSMLFLGGWSITNLAFSGAKMTQTEDSDFYFHQMNVAWNAVNLTIAGFGYWHSKRTDISSFDLSTTIKAQRRVQNILLINSGLDIAYMAGGWYLLNRSNSVEENSDLMKGYGQSLLLQGGFLLVFDLIQYRLHTKRNTILKSFSDKLEIQVGSTIGLKYRF
jgi:hypothetical protein